MRRLGKLEDALPFLQSAEAECSRANQEAGLFFCKGLYDSYRGEPQQALAHFNRECTLEHFHILEMQG